MEDASLLASLGVAAASSEAVEHAVIHAAVAAHAGGAAAGPQGARSDAERACSRLAAIEDELEALQAVLDSLQRETIDALFEEGAPDAEARGRDLEVAVTRERVAELEDARQQALTVLNAPPPQQAGPSAEVGRCPWCTLAPLFTTLLLVLPPPRPLPCLSFKRFLCWSSVSIAVRSVPACSDRYD